MRKLVVFNHISLDGYFVETVFSGGNSFAVTTNASSRPPLVKTIECSFA